MFSATRQLYMPLKRFKPKSKIPVIIVKDHIPSTGRPYFAGEKRRVKKGVMRYVLYPNKIAVYATKENEEGYESFWKSNSHYKDFLKEKKALYSLECYLKTKNLLVSEPITKELVKRYLDYCINLDVPIRSISIRRAENVPSPDAPGVRQITVKFEPVGYEMKFKATYSTSLGVPFNHFAFDKLNLKNKDPKLAEVVEEELNTRLKLVEKESELKESSDSSKDGKKKNQFMNEWMTNSTQKLTRSERNKQAEIKNSHLLKLREEGLKRAGATIVEK